MTPQTQITESDLLAHLAQSGLSKSQQKIAYFQITGHCSCDGQICRKLRNDRVARPHVTSEQIASVAAMVRATANR